MNKTAAAGQGQPARESNINAIVSYFESGIKPSAARVSWASSWSRSSCTTT